MNKLRFDKMKTERQITRNYALKKAEELIKAHPGCNGKAVEIAWQIPISKDRGVRWDNQLVFSQSSRDSIGSFAAPFSILIIE